MEGLVADLVVGTHGVNGLTCRIKSFALEVAMSGSSGMTRASIRTGGPQVHRELLPERFGNRRSVMLETLKPGAQRAVACPTELSANRIIVMEIERSHITGTG